MKRFITTGYAALVVGGLLLALGALLQGLNASGRPFSAQVTTTMFTVAAVLRLLGATGALVGVVAVCVRQAERAGRLGLVAYLLVVVNMVLQLGTMWSDLFVTDMLAQHAPALLDEGDLQGRLGLGFALAWFLNASFILLGVAVLRAHVLSRVVGWSFVVVGAVTLLPLPVDGPWFEVVIGAGFAVAGWAARSSGSFVVDVTEEQGVAPLAR